MRSYLNLYNTGKSKLFIGAGLLSVGFFMHRSFASKKPEQPIVRNRQPMTCDELIGGLRQFVSKNKKIPQFFRSIEEGDPEKNEYLQQLIAAIQIGDLNAEVFKQQDCLKHLLYLVETKKIPFWHGMTAYTYVLAYLQFIAYQKMPGVNQAVIDNSRDFITASLHPMVEAGQLTSSGELYVKNLCKNFKRFDIVLDETELIKFILMSPPIEQKLIKLKFIGSRPPSYYEDYQVGEAIGASYPYSPISEYFYLITRNNLLCRDEHSNICNIPPATLKNFIFSKMSPRPMQAKPVLGRQKQATVTVLHADNQHPVAEYLPEVNNNASIIEQHNADCGPLLVAEHDYTHVFMANLLNHEEREIIFDYLLPALKNMNNRYISAGTITNAINTLSDLDLSPIHDYEKNRFVTFVKRSMPGEIHVMDGYSKNPLRRMIESQHKLKPESKAWQQLYEIFKKPDVPNKVSARV